MNDRFVEFRKYKFGEAFQEELAQYYYAKEAYQSRPDDIMKKYFMYYRYDMVYTSLKSFWVNGYISEDTFWTLVSVLKEDL